MLPRCRAWPRVARRRASRARGRAHEDSTSMKSNLHRRPRTGPDRWVRASGAIVEASQRCGASAGPVEPVAAGVVALGVQVCSRQPGTGQVRHERAGHGGRPADEDVPGHQVRHPAEQRGGGELPSAWLGQVVEPSAGTAARAGRARRRAARARGRPSGTAGARRHRVGWPASRTALSSGRCRRHRRSARRRVGCADARSGSRTGPRRRPACRARSTAARGSRRPRAATVRRNES